MNSMAPQTPRKCAKIRQFNPRAGAYPNDNHNQHKTLNREGTINDYFGPTATQRTGRVSRIFGDTEGITRAPFEQKLASTDFDSSHLPIIVPEVTLLPSPSGSNSTVSSPGSDHGVWDSPKTPSLRPTQQLGVGSVTPLTPPTTYELPSDDTPSRKPSRFSFNSNVKGKTIFDQIESRSPNHRDEEGLPKCRDEDEDSLSPKFIRGCTGLLQAISEGNANVVAELKYNLQSSPTFSFDADAPVSSRTRSSIKRENDTKDKSVKAAFTADNELVEIKVETSSQSIGPNPASRGTKRHIYYRQNGQQRDSPIKFEGVDVTIKDIDVKVENREVISKFDTLPRTKSSLKGFSATLEQIVPSELHERLKERPHQCVASQVKKPQELCRCKAKGPLRNVDAVCEAISKCEERATYTTLPLLIEKLVRTVMCGTHQNAALEGPKTDPRMAKLQKFLSSLSESTDNDRAHFSKWIRAISNRSVPLGALRNKQHVYDLQTDNKPPTSMPRSTQVPPIPISKVNVTMPATTTTNNTTTIIPLTLSRKFLPFQPQWSKSLPVSEALLSIITEPLKPTDKKSGFIYIFWDQEHFGRVKIGRTNDLDRRLKEWNEKCKRVFSYHTASKGGKLVEIPHVNRIERLMHIELKDCRKQRKCEGCGTNHQEWFEVSETHAVNVFLKWQKWIVQKPYALDHASGMWKIRPEMMETLVGVCQPVPEDVVELKIPVKKDNTRRKSGRRSVLPTKSVV